MKKTSLLGALCACVFSLGISTAANSTVIDAYFGMNFLNSTGGSIEAQLMDITYIGGGGLTYTTLMPAFSGYTCNSGTGPTACVGLPDIGGATIVNSPTYTTGGDGETTRTIGQTVPINWDVSGLFPSITITDITAFATGGTWTANVAGGYTVGLIPGSSGSSELSSLLAAPQGDIYDAAAGAAGNSIATFIATSAPPAFSGLEGQAFGDFIFAAASPVPVPPAIWLFGSGLLSLAGVARRKNSA